MTTEVLRLGMDTTGMVAGSAKAKTAVQGVTTSLTAAQKAMAGVGIALTAMVLVYGAGVKSFIEFDSAMTQSLSIMSDVTVALEKDMVDAARAVAVEMNFAATETAEAFFFLASAGLDAERSIAALPAVARFARAGMFDLAMATDLATDAQSALGLASKNAQTNLLNMTRVTDVLVKANTLANATVEQFATALTSEAGAALKTFGIDIEEGVAVLAAFADQGVKAQIAGTGLSRILRLMTSAAVNNAQAYRDLNVAVFDGQGNIRNLADIIGDLERATGEMSDAARVAAFEQLGFQARVQGVILPLLGASEKIREYEVALRAAGGTTKEVADKQMASLANRIGQIKQAFSNWRDTLIEKTVPAIELLIDKADELADALKALFLVIGAAGLTAGLLLLGAAIAATVTAISAAVIATGSLTAAMMALTFSIPIWGQVAAVIAIATAVVYKFIRAKRDEQEAIKASNEKHQETLANVHKLSAGQLELSKSLIIARQAREKLALIEAMGTDQQEEATRKLAQTNDVYREIIKAQEELAGARNPFQPSEDGAEAAKTAFEQLLEVVKQVNDAIAEAADTSFFERAAEVFSGRGGGAAGSMQFATPSLGDIELGPMLTDLAEGQRLYAESIEETGTSLSDVLDEINPVLGGFAAISDALGLAAQKAIRGASDIISGIGNIASGALAGGIAGIIGGAVGLVGGLFGGDAAAKQREEQRNKLLADNNARLHEMTQALIGGAQFGQAGLVAEGLKGLLAQMGGGQRFGEILGGKEIQGGKRFEAVQDLLGGLGMSLEEFNAIVKETGIQILDSAGRLIPEALDQFIAATQLAIQALAEEQAAFDRNLEVRSLLARGLDEEAELLRQQIANEKELDEARRLGLDTTKLVAVQEEERIARLEAEADALERANAAFTKDIDQRRTTLDLGDTAKATAFLEDMGLAAGDFADVSAAAIAIYQKQVQQQNEMNAAIEAGFSPELLAALGDIQGDEMAAFIEGLKEIVKITLPEGFLADIVERESALASDAFSDAMESYKEGAMSTEEFFKRAADERLNIQAQLQTAADAEIAKAQELVDAGVLTAEQFQNLKDVIGGEMAVALADFDQGVLDAAEAMKEAAQAAREAADAERFRQMVDMENLRVRLLVAQGMDGEAQALRNQLELLKAIKDGRSGEYIALLQQVQAVEAAQKATRAQTAALQETKKAAEDVSSALNSPQGVNLSLARFRASVGYTGPGNPAAGSSPVNRIGTQGAGTAPQINIVINAVEGQSEQEIANKVVAEIQRLLRAGAPNPITTVVS